MNILLICFFFIGYFAIGIVAGATEVKWATGKDTWSNLWEHKWLFVDWVLFWFPRTIETLFFK